MRNTNKIFVYLALILLVAIQFFPVLAAAQERAPAAATGFEKLCDKTVGIGGCIARIYLFSLGAGALIALLMVVLAGYRYMSASGNAEQVSAAKESLESALKGLIIIFVGFILLYLINPDLVQFNNTFQLPTLIP